MIAMPAMFPIASRQPALRIALVGTQSGWSGGESQAHLLAQGLRRRGHRVIALSRYRSLFSQVLRKDGFEVREFCGRGRNPWGAWQIRQAIADIRPDIVHMNDPHALTSVGIALLGKQSPPRILSRRVDFPLRAALRYRLWSDRIVCVSRAVANVCAQAGIPFERLQVIPDGCDPQRLTGGNRQQGRQALQAGNQDAVLLTVARLSHHKGHRYLLAALPQVLSHYPRTILALAGDGEARAELEQQARRLGIDRHVRFLGHCQDQHVANLLAAADLFVMPSQLEGLCSSVIDAMLAGLPTIATSAGGIPDLLGEQDGHPAVGILVPPADPAALSGAILLALNQPEYCAELADTARQRALRSFTVETMVEQTLAAYRQLIRDRSPGPYQLPRATRDHLEGPSTIRQRPHPSYEAPSQAHIR